MIREPMYLKRSPTRAPLGHSCTFGGINLGPAGPAVSNEGQMGASMLDCNLADRLDRGKNLGLARRESLGETFEVAETKSNQREQRRGAKSGVYMQKIKGREKRVTA